MRQDEKNIKQNNNDLLGVIDNEINHLRKEFKETLADAEKRIIGSITMEIKELNRKVFMSNLDGMGKKDELKERLDWIIGALKQLEDKKN